MHEAFCFGSWTSSIIIHKHHKGSHTSLRIKMKAWGAHRLDQGHKNSEWQNRMSSNSLWVINQLPFCAMERENVTGDEWLRFKQQLCPIALNSALVRVKCCPCGAGALSTAGSSAMSLDKNSGRQPLLETSWGLSAWGWMHLQSSRTEAKARKGARREKAWEGQRKTGAQIKQQHFLLGKVMCWLGTLHQLPKRFWLAIFPFLTLSDLRCL